MNVPPTRRRADGYPDGDPYGLPPPPSPSPAELCERSASYSRIEAFIGSGSGDDQRRCDLDRAPLQSNACAVEGFPEPTLFVQQPGDPDPIDAADVRQGIAGDCFFTAALAAVANTPSGRALLRAAIAENRGADGQVVSYTVTLHRPATHWLGFAKTTFEQVRVTVDAHCYPDKHALPRSQPGEPHEVWPVVLEKAYAQYAGGYDAIAHGGYADQVLAVLTGREPAIVSVGPWFGRYKAADLARDIEAGRAVVLTTADEYPMLTLQEGHCYTATGVVTVGGRLRVQLYDSLRSSTFTVPIEELVRCRGTMTIGSVGVSP
ncbi:MAG TPA: C2 family cysteine protease [Polyangiaceae bacterium]|nr:C2 family cysteine protease [Polyangiaceae bacterium]